MSWFIIIIRKITYWLPYIHFEGIFLSVHHFRCHPIRCSINSSIQWTSHIFQRYYCTSLGRESINLVLCFYGSLLLHIFVETPKSHILAHPSLVTSTMSFENTINPLVETFLNKQGHIYMLNRLTISSFDVSMYNIAFYHDSIMHEKLMFRNHHIGKGIRNLLGMKIFDGLKYLIGQRSCQLSNKWSCMV